MKDRFHGKEILITAGPACKHLDPVRFITNESSSKMGYAITESLYPKWADVLKISGPVSLQSRLPDDKGLKVITAGDLYDTCKSIL